MTSATDIYISSSMSPLLGRCSAMLNNTTALTINKEAGFSCFTSWGTAIATANYLSLVINMLHLVVITSFKSLNTRPHRLILTHLALVNMASGLGIAVSYTCLPVLSLLRKFTLGFPVAGLLCEWPIFVNHLIFLVTAFEQYYARSNPVKYALSYLIRYVNSVLLSQWLITFCIQLAFLASMSIAKGKPPGFFKAATMGRFVVEYLPLVMAGVLFNMIARELLRTAGATVTSIQRRNRQMTVYFIIIYSTFIITTLVDVFLTCVVLFNPGLILFHSRRLRNLTQPFYGITTIVIYGLRDDSYYQHIQQIFCRKYRRDGISQRGTRSTDEESGV